MRLDKPEKQYSSFELKFFLVGILLAVILVLPSLSYVRHYLIDKGFVAHHTSASDKALQLADNLVRAPFKLIAAQQQFPLIKVDIKYKEWLKLESDRKKAFINGVIPEIRHEVTATIYHENNKIPAKVRLQGDMLDHVNKVNRWSLKVSLKKKKAIFNARKFALLAPSVRGHQGDSLFAKSLAIANFDIISPKHIPVKVEVNGNDWGLMFLEQGFSQSLLAVNNRTEGLITRLDLISEVVDDNNKVTRLFKSRVLQRNTILKNDSLAKQRKIALALLTDFLNGERIASEVFDAKILGQYLAMVDLWGAWHALAWNNWRWYYNPHTAKLEPIQSDVGLSPAAHIWLTRVPSETFEITKSMLADAQVKAEYDRAKQSLINILDSKLIPQLMKFETTLLTQLHSNSPLIASYDYQIMLRQARCWQENYQSINCQSFTPVSESLHKQLNFFQAKVNWDLASQLVEREDQVYWQVKNNDKVALNIREVEGVTTFDEVTQLTEINDNLPLQLGPGEKTTIPLPKNLALLKVNAGLVGKKVMPFHFSKNVKPLSFVPRATTNNDDLFPYRQFIQQSKNRWQLKPGKWHINSYLVTPAKTKVVIPAGTELVFGKNAGLMVFGTLHIKGSAANPVVFTKHKDAAKWSGLSVFAPTAETEHNINHLNIAFASSPKLGLWQPRGAIYFVKGIVNMFAVKISDNQSEDGLNIINAQVNIDGITISNTLSDAFDCDFCTGEINNSYFNNIGFRSGGDGIDVSGSDLIVRRAKFNQVRDKAISAGESSRLYITDASFNDVNFGLVAKDDSYIEANRVTANNVQHMALMTYSKKTIFGPATMKVNQYSCLDVNCQTKSVSALGSQLRVNGLKVPSQALDVKNLYNTIMKSDKPK